MSSTIPNLFGKLIGFGSATITRHAVADYTGRQPMGSPCNTLGIEPLGTSGFTGGVAQLSAPPLANCSTNPQFWMNVNGPNVPKGNGDQYAVRTCASGVSGCTGTANDDSTRWATPIWCGCSRRRSGTSSPCSSTIRRSWRPTTSARTAPTGTVDNDNWNDFATTDAKSRYKKPAAPDSPNGFCTGDQMADADAGVRPHVVRARALRSQNPKTATPEPGCTRQYPGYTSAQLTANALKKGNAAYNAPLAKVFHQWVTLCSFTPTRRATTTSRCAPTSRSVAR